jgi:hypothetical protein
MAITVPYETASSGAAARDEIVKILRRFGCASIGFRDDFDAKAVQLVFDHRGAQVDLRISAKGWAALYLEAHPYTIRMRKTLGQHHAHAVEQGMIAVNSILRDWVKAHVTMVECGAMTFPEAFAAHMIAPDGRRVIEHLSLKNLLPGPSHD